MFAGFFVWRNAHDWKVDLIYLFDGHLLLYLQDMVWSLMFQTKRFGLVASKQEYLMLCHAERTLKHKKKPAGQRLSAFKVCKK